MARTWANPGASVRVTVRFRVGSRDAGRTPGAATSLKVDVLDIARIVGTVRRRIRATGDVQSLSLAIRLPLAPRHGYGIRATLETDHGSSTRTAAIEAIDGWWEAPRHVALTDFAPSADAEAQIDAARGWHVTVAQAYDWMFRHYRYPAPREPFLDALGRTVSHAVVRALVREAHAAGIAVLAYGSVYGAEPEYVADHPDERVFDDAGEPLSLGGAFFINDLRPGQPWRSRLLDQYEVAVRRFGFDGIHMDTYGPPHEAVAHDGAPLRFADLYPALIEEAGARVAAARRGARVLFNCVEGFPIDAVAGAPMAALYLELWPPDDTFADLVRWIDRSRLVSAGRATVIAAYVPALRDAGDGAVTRARAIESAAILTSVIHAAGAFHHVLAEHDRLLVEGYYPAAIALRPAEVRELRAAWTFGARYLHLLSDPGTTRVDASSVRLRDGSGDPVPVSLVPRAGTVWASSSRTPAGEVTSLIDLREAADDRWTSAQPPARSNQGWRVAFDDDGSTGAAGTGEGRVAMSPWTRAGDAVPLPEAPDGWSGLPTFRRWIVVHRPTNAG